MGNYLHTLSRAAQVIQQKIIRTHLSLHISQVCDNSREAVWKTQFYVYVEASGKLCVSTRISRVPENLWEEMTRTRHLVNGARICGTSLALGRPLSVPFLLRTSGKGTDVATPLGLEKYGRIDFALKKWTK